MTWRLIVSPPADGPSNMATDEALLNTYGEQPGSQPVLRLYRWAAPCVTIGYFQKYADVDAGGLPVTRRLTGGLTVVHGKDISYCLITGKEMWPSVYDQTETYRLLHSVIERVLQDMGIAAYHAAPSDAPHKGMVCVETVYQYDVMSGGRKIVGSCQRRRGETILVQGSIHVPSLVDRAEDVARLFTAHGGMMGADDMRRSVLSAREESVQALLVRETYGREEWNRKF